MNLEATDPSVGLECPQAVGRAGEGVTNIFSRGETEAQPSNCGCLAALWPGEVFPVEK